MNIGTRIHDYKERAVFWGQLARESASRGEMTTPQGAYDRARTAAHYANKALALRATIKRPCECSDPGCPNHQDAQCWGAAYYTLTRVDMDNAKVRFCAACADDAIASGVFA